MKLPFCFTELVLIKPFKLLHIGSDNFFQSFLADSEYHHSRSVHILRLPKNQAFLRCPHLSETADELGPYAMEQSR